MIEITESPIDTNQLLAAAQSPAAGAVVMFVGTTREMTGDQQTTTLVYDAYRPMALQEMGKLREEAIRRWMLTHCAIVHRLGEVPLAEASVAIVAASAHREAAFDAAEWIIDSLKQQVPIWKQEHWIDGSTEWVHPSGEAMKRSEQ